MITAMILAGGVGSRVGYDRPKQFVEVLDKPILAYTIEIFQNNPQIDSIEVVCNNAWMDYCRNMISSYKLDKVSWLTHGGSTFQESVINGIKCLDERIKDDDYVLIHYGAAPFTSQRIVNDVIRVMKEKDSAFTATPCYQLMGSNDGKESRSWVNRDKYVQIASPYGFKFSYLKDIYERAEKSGVLASTEPHTTSLMYALGDTLYQAYGDQTNIKITTKEDIELFEGYAMRQMKKL